MATFTLDGLQAGATITDVISSIQQCLNLAATMIEDNPNTLDGDSNPTVRAPKGVIFTSLKIEYNDLVNTAPGDNETIDWDGDGPGKVLYEFVADNVNTDTLDEESLRYTGDSSRFSDSKDGSTALAAGASKIVNVPTVTITLHADPSNLSPISKTQSGATHGPDA